MTAERETEQDVERFVDRAIWKLEDAASSITDGDIAGAWSNDTLAADVIDREEEIEVVVDVPGFAAEDVELRVTDEKLTVEARRERTEETEEDDYIRRERSQRSIRREINLPEEIDEDTVEAEIEDGVLTVTAQKSRVEQGREIEVS